MNTRSASAGMTGRLMTMTAHPGKGEELAALLLRVAEGLHGFPGCEIYLISRDSADPDTVHVTEVWRSEADAQAALAASPTAGAPAPADVLALLSSPPRRTDLTVLGGVGLPAADGRS
ncbi:antibiotic biosynthesis monooxygenase family protein [Streptomyces sp. DG2A-72]|uniref:putative quinol monooxygenase n=1 Tax=Streptomyces sp. DG2A-72 TaxID=3051386 RepID=UPI00265C6A24|nr:antibiotic biosynthesis monooxygenase family protein [Streptomyces sp. DG2A-72]MDO0932142.1 antibiotic biosynthesis monooxygenase family protein [Streptomyces sp. DG2A-72]